MDPSGKMLFTCNACGYRARIPERYSGKEVHCPRCQVVQVAQTGIGGNMTGQTLTFQNLKAAYVGEQSAMKSVEKPDDTVRFTCGSCQYSASLAGKHAGTSIRCPGCGASQAVPARADGGIAAGDTGSFAAPKSAANEDRILFTCGDCDYKARIPARYSGRSVLCPGCGKAVPASATVAMQVANLETAPAPTGNTTILNRVTATPAPEGQPQTGALTRVGMQFTCRNCGYQSRISPSCAGGVIYCPSCRGEQMVDMGGGLPSTPASEALERRAAKDDDAIEPTITPARGTRAISGPLPVVEAERKKSSPLQIVDDDPPIARPASGPHAAVAPTAKATPAVEEGRTPSGRFPSSVAPFSVEQKPLPHTDSHKASASDRRTAKTAPLTAVTPAKGIPVAKVPLAKDAGDDDESLAAEARSLARRSVPQAPASPVAASSAAAEPVKATAKPVVAKAKPNAAVSAAPSSSPASPAPAVSSRNRGMWAAVALLMMAIAALGVITWQWDLKRKALVTEQGQHTATRGQLVTEQAAHVATRADLSATQERLAGEEKVHALTRERLAASEAAHTKATSELGIVRDELSLTMRQLSATKNELATVQSALDEQTQARQAADTRFDELDARWQDAKQRLGDLLEPAGTKIATPVPKAPAPAAAPQAPADKGSAKHEF
ncbi:MAG TPA: hypothetical protein VEL07_06270 [Planctomycetota bacterium]|nr:hypothetical protein [Planctomycetota bacterium]